jgi:hypothetical protein
MLRPAPCWTAPGAPRSSNATCFVYQLPTPPAPHGTLDPPWTPAPLIQPGLPLLLAGTLDYMAPEVLKCPLKRLPGDNKDKQVGQACSPCPGLPSRPGTPVQR